MLRGENGRWIEEGPHGDRHGDRRTPWSYVFNPFDRRRSYHLQVFATHRVPNAKQGLG